MSDGAHFNRFLTVMASIMLVLATLAASNTGARAAASQLKVGKSHAHPDMLVMKWEGAISKTMADDISAAFEQRKDSVRSVEFIINSGGGSVMQGERVIKVLQGIKKTHALYTGVLAGNRCGSMCVFIFVQGQKRFAAPSSVWLFHEVSRSDKGTHEILELDRKRWEELIAKYWVPAGVNATWIEEMKAHTFKTDYFQTGQNLIENSSGIVQKALSDEHRRVVVGAKRHYRQGKS